MAAVTRAGDTTIRVRVQPKASRNQVLGFREDALRLQVTAPPEDGKANAAVIRLLAQTLDIPQLDLAIVRGHSSRDKVIRVSSLGATEVRKRLDPVA